MRGRPKKASACVDVREQRSSLPETTDGAWSNPNAIADNLALHHGSVNDVIRWRQP